MKVKFLATSGDRRRLAEVDRGTWEGWRWEREEGQGRGEGEGRGYRGRVK